MGEAYVVTSEQREKQYSTVQCTIVHVFQVGGLTIGTNQWGRPFANAANSYVEFPACMSQKFGHYANIRPLLEKAKKLTICIGNSAPLRTFFLKNLEKFDYRFLRKQKLFIGPFWVTRAGICRSFKETRYRFSAWRAGTKPYLSYWPARLHRWAKSTPRNRFLGSINVYNYGLRLKISRVLTSFMWNNLGGRSALPRMFLKTLLQGPGKDSQAHIGAKNISE